MNAWPGAEQTAARLSSRPARPRTKEEGYSDGGFVRHAKSSNGQYFFVLKAGNGERIAQSEMYSSKSATLSGIESVKANAPTAPVDDQTGD
jgi:uncharacterized protein YegP (UPF0339 family)